MNHSKKMAEVSTSPVTDAELLANDSRRPTKTIDTTRRPLRFLPRSIWARGLFSLGIVMGLVIVTAAVVVLSVWIEDRFPSSDAKRSLVPAVQRVFTKPIVDALSRQVERYVHSRAEALYMHTGLTLEETITRFLDEHVDLAQRRIYAYRLAHVGSPDAMAALLSVFRSAPPEHKAFMAQLISSTGNPAVKEWLLPLLNEANERLAIAAIRGLSAIGGDEISARIAEILKDHQRSDRVRVEAAQGLAVIGTPAAIEILAEAFGQVSQDDVATEILRSLGQFPFPTIAKTFSDYLSAPETPEEMRVVVVEALAFSTQEAVPFLLGLAESDVSTDVRASAAWAISTHTDDRYLGETLARLAEREQETDVRRRLYEAMLPQVNILAERLLPLVQAEDDIATRVAGFNAIGRAAGLEPSSVSAAVFDQQIVPELLQIATSENSLNIQMRAVFALRYARTAAAQGALSVIAKTARPQVATAARNGL
jgi:HEAT repeat protein